MSKQKITLPLTKAELAQSHSFKAFIYPQIIEANALLSSIIYNNYSNIIAGIKKVEKNLTKNIESRRKMGNYEVFQNIPTQLEYGLVLDKVVFYKDQNNEIAKFLEIESNGLIKQFFPFIIQEDITNPDGTSKDTTIWFDCWITNDDTSIDLDTNDVLVVKSLKVKVGQMLNKHNGLVGFLKSASEKSLSIASALNQAVNLGGEIGSSTVKLIENIKL
jgi:hypothetical protein